VSKKGKNTFMPRKRKSDPINIYEMNLHWTCVCGHVTSKPRKEFKPPYFVCAGCKKEIVVDEIQRDRMFCAQVQQGRDAVEKLTKK
jgi:hypothetical protein